MQVPFSAITYLKNNFTTEVPFMSSVYNHCLYSHVDADNAILHIWTTPKQVALGPRDKQLPDSPAAIAWLAANDYTMYNRNAGGLAVIGDSDILNASLIFQQPDKPLSIDAAYQLVVTLLQKALPTLTLTTGEVATSYCPGAYDISVNGQKIAGLAQHRYQNKIAISFYLSIAGNQATRCAIIKQMYLIGLNSDIITPPYPNVNANSMTTLAALDTNYSMEQVINNLTINWLPMLPFNRSLISTTTLNHQIERLQLRQSPLITALNIRKATKWSNI
ncbi:lipoate--protein ligase family protein [Periweissella fabalis]|uniref:BPL/LPL catalytic domain-containing protein n=1 Tax=Periweissella fabalis TaxID=1070421 RepID=A0A7X6N381_9LACO|nr:hypothetical protein [Periweissella fabalis]MCM0599602.1 hypothetical protein [Periweissella fabalis]NKZ23907.1 hypothetical protein [Periweissella fabalis]